MFSLQVPYFHISPYNCLLRQSTTTNYHDHLKLFPSVYCRFLSVLLEPLYSLRAFQAWAHSMPTPSSSSHVPLDLSATTVPHATCPPDDDRSVWRSEAMEDSHEEVDVPVSATPQLLNNSPPSSQPAGSTETHITQQRIPKRIDMDEEASASEMLSPMSTEGEKHDERDLQVLARTDMGSSSMGYDFSNIRVREYNDIQLLLGSALTCCIADSLFALMFPSRWQQIHWNPEIGAPGL